MLDDGKRHLFLIAAVIILVISPFILLLLPTVVLQTLYHSNQQIVLYIASGNYLVYAAGFLLIFLSVLFIFLLWGRKSAVFASLVCFIASGCFFYMAAQHYISIDSDKLSYRSLFSLQEHSYQWDEFEKAFYVEDGYGNVAPTYEFVLPTGEIVRIPEGVYLKEYKRAMSRLLKEKGIEYERKFISEGN